ncbi:MAG: hypothetical protein RBR97_16895 [Bacteroidales bacterium]|nr:hypothetical protein [Bacteroidales bacterium]
MKRTLQSYLLTALCVVLLSPVIMSQNDEKPKVFGIKFQGYVKNDFFYDSRQTVDAREGHLLLYPKAPSLDANGNDINAHGSFNFLAIQTRLKGVITGPDALGAQTSGAIEGEFFGHTNGDINGLRLRHAIIKFDWEKSHLMTGQYWHPMFITECFPGTVSFNTGLGFAPFSRNPQIKYSFTAGGLKISATAYSERDFASKDITGVSSPSYIRNSGIPGANIHLNYGTSDIDAGTAFNTGFAVNYHTMLPSLTTTANYITNQTVTSMSGLAYVNAKMSKINIKIAGTYCENPTGIMMPGGYAVFELLNATSLEVNYIPTRCATGWIDISSTGTKWNFGIFAGYNQNLGAAKNIIGIPGGSGTNIDHLYRVSPRVNFHTGKIQIGAEIEYTVAAYGDGTYNPKGVPLNSEEVANIRFITGIYYHF